MVAHATNYRDQQTPIPAQTSVAAASAPMRGPALQVSTSQEHMKPSTTIQPLAGVLAHYQPQEFPDVPGSESMEFVEKLMENLRKVSQRSDYA